MLQILTVMRAISRVLDHIGGLVVLPVLTIVMTVDVIMRYVFNAPFIWGLELDVHLLIIIFMFGILECTRTGGNIRMDLVYLHMPDRARRMVALLLCAIGCYIFVLLAGKAASEIPFLLSIQEESEYLHLPKGWYYTGIVAVSVLMALYFALRAVSIVIGSAVPEDEIESETQGEM